MKLGVSNLAWDGDMDLSLLKQSGLNFVEVVIPKFVDWRDLSDRALVEFACRVRQSGMDVQSTQSVFFNSGVSSFHNPAFVEHLKIVSRLCRVVGIKKIILGSPTLRTNKIDKNLIQNFRCIDQFLQDTEQTLLIEPNTRHYGGNYFFQVGEIVDFITQNNLNSIRTMIDTHNVILENQDPSDVLIRALDYIDHIHVSEADLNDFYASKNHDQFARFLRKCGYSGIIVYEAKPSPNVLNSIKAFIKTYNL